MEQNEDFKPLNQEELRAVKEKISIAKTGILNKKTEYQYFVDNSRIIPSYQVPTMGVTLLASGITIFYNPIFTQGLSTLNVAGVLLHEFDHVLMDHMNRVKNFKDYKDNFSFHNICQDLIINQNNNWLPDGCVTLEGMRKMSGVHLRAHESYEYYYHAMKGTPVEQMAQNSGSGDGSGRGVRGENADVHGEQGLEKAIAEAGLGGEKLSESEKEAMRQEVARGIKENGNVPGHMKGYIDDLLASQINWKRELRHFVGKFVDTFSKPTRMRRNRRYGILEPGKRKKRGLPSVQVLVDTSGSVSDSLYAAFISEINEMKKSGYKIDYIISDTEVKEHGPFDIEKLKNRKGYGGTSHDAGLRFADSQEPDLIIGFSDGDPTGDSYVTKAPLIWVLSNDTKPPTECRKKIIIQE